MNMNIDTETNINTNEATFRFFAYDSKMQYPAPDAMRLVTCLYRTKKGETPARPNEGIFIPDWITPEIVEQNMSKLVDYFTGYLQEQENERVKESHKLHSKGFGGSFFTLANLISYLEDKGAGARLSGETIKEWYVESGLEEAVTALYLEKLGADQQDKVEAISSFICKKLESLASPKTIWSEEEKEKLVPILETVADTSTGAKLLGRVERMKEADSLLDAL